MNTLDGRTRAEIGRSANRKGKDAEQAVARYLREHGWPGAQRMVRTGWKVGDQVSRDHGDITGTARLCWQVKTSASDFTDSRVLRVLAGTVDQAVAGGADYGIAIERRAGKTNPGRWFAWLSARDLAALLSPAGATVAGRDETAPVRMLLEDLVPLLHAAGYGQPHSPQATAESATSEGDIDHV